MNRQVIADATAVPFLIVFADQTHEDRIMKVTKEQKGRGSLQYDEALSRTDGLYTSEPNIMLALCFADCVPLYFLAPQSGLIERLMPAGKEPSNKLAPTWLMHGFAKKALMPIIYKSSLDHPLAAAAT